uniref:Replication factor A C-terminal domain-containing protein n=2 Tax=Daucus carota subsp. sativus TaxID=79200 RepID=A0A162AIX6_DAUCS
MHASVPRHLVSRFKRRVGEGKLYGLRNVKVTTNTYPYRPLASDKKLLFLATTEVVELGDDAVRIAMHGFQFVGLPVLQSRAGDVTILSDIVGCFCGYGEVETVGDGLKRKRDIKIFTDYSVTSTITLLGKLGELFDPTLYTQDGGPYVMVVTSVTVKTYQRALTFATTSGSRIYVNPDEQHVSSVRERFSALSTKVVALEGTSASKLPPEEAMFVNRMTVDDLVGATCSGELKAAIATLKVIITAVNTRFGWYYVSCKSCVKKATPVDGVYVCAEGKKPVDYPLHMFRINLQVEDDTGTTTVVLFNNTAERLLDTSVKKLINKMSPGDNSPPAELQTLLGKQFVFKLALNKYNWVDGRQDYGVAAVYVPVPDLEAAYTKKKMPQDAPDQAGSSGSAGEVDAEANSRKRKLPPVLPAVAESEETAT